MTAEGVRRRLAAILAADAVGFSRLIGRDDERTLAALTAHRAELIEPNVGKHDGRIFKLTGDGFLAHFASAVDALRCAVTIQDGMKARNAGVPAEERIEFRIGIAVGDVMVQDGDVYGEGVNIAARLEGLAEPGGICVSAEVNEHAKRSVSVGFEDVGPQRFKNMSAPVHVYRVSPAASEVRETLRTAVPKRGAIAVLPFVNLSGDPEQEYFADGISEDIITALSNVRTFAVLARSSTSAYKGKAVDTRQIGRDLDADYVVEGSVRRAGDRVRVTAQLIEARTGDHLWAERYDGRIEDIFDLQDEITASIVGTIEPELVLAEGARLRSKPPENLNAYDCLLRGLTHMYKLTPGDTRHALGWFEKAIELDPNYGRAYAFASWCYRRDSQQSGLFLSEEDRTRAVELAHQALRCDRNDPYVMVYAAVTFYQIEGDFDEALALIDRALSMHPNSHRFWNAKAQVHSYRGEPEVAIRAGDRAIALSPNEPAIWVAYWSIAEAHLQKQRYEEAVAFSTRALRHNPYLLTAHYILAAAHAHLGRMPEARAALARALEGNPGMTLERFPRHYRIGQFLNLAAYLEGLRMSGLPEK